jgi:hypothetical protein
MDKVKGKDVPGGATLNGDGTPSASATAAAATAAKAAKSAEAELMNGVEAKATDAVNAVGGGLMIKLPNGAPEQKGGAFSFKKWLGLDDTNVWRG